MALGRSRDSSVKRCRPELSTASPCFTASMTRLRKLFFGGSAANEQLTAIVATLLLVMLALDGATLLRLTSLLAMHAFVGMLLIPVVCLKLASTGWRMARYYLRGESRYAGAAERR